MSRDTDTKKGEWKFSGDLYFSDHRSPLLGTRWNLYAGAEMTEAGLAYTYHLVAENGHKYTGHDLHHVTLAEQCATSGAIYRHAVNGLLTQDACTGKFYLADAAGHCLMPA